MSGARQWKEQYRSSLCSALFPALPGVCVHGDGEPIFSSHRQFAVESINESLKEAELAEPAFQALKAIS